jgi:hypothetical protein
MEIKHTNVDILNKNPIENVEENENTVIKI